jgi:hypothetical protein
VALRLSLVFLLSFAAPIFLSYLAYKHFYSSTSAADEEISSQGISVIAKTGDRPEHITLAADNRYNPQPERNFLLAFWVKVRKLPSQGEKVTLINKINDESKSGYRIMLDQHSGKTRLVIEWGDGKKSLYPFNDIPFETKNWILVAVVLEKGRYLGVLSSHLSSVSQELASTEISLAGGYDLQREFALNESDQLIYGGVRKNPIEAQLGPLLIASYKPEDLETKKIIREIIKNPDVPPKLLKERQIKLFISEAKDLGEKS